MPKTKQKSFTFLTWNLCLLENSHQAPSNWQMDQAEAKVRELVLELDPDFAEAYEVSAVAAWSDAGIGWTSRHALSLAKEFAQKALQLKPDLLFSSLSY